jgi:hypothetical protein
MLRDQRPKARSALLYWLEIFRNCGVRSLSAGAALEGGDGAK